MNWFHEECTRAAKEGWTSLCCTPGEHWLWYKPNGLALAVAPEAPAGFVLAAVERVPGNLTVSQLTGWIVQRTGRLPLLPMSLQDRLKGIKVLYQSPQGLYGIPYKMRPGQAPRDLWKGAPWPKPGWSGTPGRCEGPREDWILLDRKLPEVQAFLREHSDLNPTGLHEWSTLARKAEDAKDVHDERRRREEAQARDEYMRSRMLVPDGCCLVDDGCEGGYVEEAGCTFRVPWDPCVYYDVRVSEWPTSMKAKVTAGTRSWDLEDVVEMLEKKRLRCVAASEVPPRAVLDRIGHHALHSITARVIEGKAVWIGRPRFGELMVLDEKGKIVRKQSIVKEALK